MAVVRNWRRLLLNPLPSGKNGNQDGDAEEGLSHGGVGCRNRGRQKIQHRHSPQYALNDNGCERGKAQIFHPAAAVHEQGPKRDHDSEDSGRCGDHAMAVLKTDPAHPGRQAEDVSIGGWPVRDREPRIFARNQGSRNNDDKSKKRNEDRDAVMPGIVGSGFRLQGPSSRPDILSEPRLDVVPRVDLGRCLARTCP